MGWFEGMAGTETEELFKVERRLIDRSNGNGRLFKISNYRSDCSTCPEAKKIEFVFEKKSRAAWYSFRFKKNPL
jgi:hypothetical protein